MTGQRQSITGKTRIVILVGLIFLGALLWAKGRDPFQRIWFKVKTPNFGKAEGVAVLPKMAPRPLAVVVYLHGSGGTLLGNGNDLRQMAEMGLAAIGMEYNQTNEAAFEEQFAALQDWVRKQKWADPNQVAWVGYSLGAQRQWSFILKHPERQPPLLVRFAGGWGPEFEASSPKSGISSQKPNQSAPPLPSVGREDSEPPVFKFQPATILLIHGEQDTVFPVAEARRAAAALQTNGFQVSLWTLPGQSHSLAPNREMLFRAIGECALTHLQGTNALDRYESMLSGQERAKPLWLFWMPAALWVVLGWYSNRNFQQPGNAGVHAGGPQSNELAGRDAGAPRLKRWEVALRWLAGTMVLFALGVTALHLIPPRLEITPGQLELTRKYLVAPKAAADFDNLSTNSFWAGKKLKTLLEHVELANYNRELVNWKLDDETYRRYVLSPEIAPEWDGAMHWRRWLWESFYPRIRKEENPMTAAEIVVRHLRGRVTIVGSKPLTPDAGRDAFHPRPNSSGEVGDAVERVPTRRDESSRKGGAMEQSSGAPLSLPKDIEQIWIRQITDERSFDALYVAAMRSAGVPARVAANQKAEIWTGAEWKPAPRPLMETWE